MKIKIKNTEFAQRIISDMELICSNRNLRFTPLRKRVLEIIAQENCSIKAYDILYILQKEDPSAKPSTVYRTLDFLINNGIIHKLNSSNRYTACSHPREERNQCYFMICEQCNSIKEYCNSDLITEEIYNIAGKHNFKTSNISIEIKGICGNCN